MSFPAFFRSDHWMAALPRFSGGPGEVSLAGANVTAGGRQGPRNRIFGQWALVYLAEGEGFYRDERGHEENVREGQWILVFPEIAHSYGSLARTKWKEIYVCFRGPIFEAWRESGCLDPSRPVGDWLPPSKGMAAFGKFFRDVQQSGCSSLAAVCLWQSLLGAIVGAPSEPAEGQPGWLERSFDLLEHFEPGSVRSIREIARICGLSYESFRKKFGHAVGIPPGRYALMRRVERARRLITLQHLPNKEIAALLGFHDEFHFSKTFSHFTGKTPRQFRKETDARGNAEKSHAEPRRRDFM